MDLERSIDGAIGRMVSWLTLAPIHPRTHAPAAPPAGSAAEPAAAAEPVPAASEPVPAAAAPSLEDQILAALAASEDGASTAELRRQTGAQPATLRARLNRLIGSGRVQRRGQGMRTRYHLVTAGQDDG